MELGGVSIFIFFGYDIVAASVDQQAKVFGYLFISQPWSREFISFHIRDPWRVSMALFYTASAVGVAFAGDMLSLFLWWEGLAVTSSFSDLGTKDQDGRGFRFSLPVFSYLIGFTSFVRHSSSVSLEGASALALHSLTDPLESGISEPS